MAVDVQVKAVIARPPTEVARYAGDPGNAPEWYANIRMRTMYTWRAEPGGGTRMTLRNTGEPSGFAHLAAPVVERAMRRATGKDLAWLRALLEAAGPGAR